MALFQFVDSISASPVVRLDLNAGGLWIGDDGLDLSPAPLRRAVVSTLLADGDQIPATAWGNRVLKLPVQLVQASVDSAATALQQLARELVRDRNILRVQLGTVPYFFRTFSAPDYAWSMPKLLAQYGKAVLEIPAEPFAYGLKETLGQVTVNNDPAAVSNPMWWDITDVKGDVETPALLKFGSSGLISSNEPKSVLAIRRRGTPSNAPFLLQAESMTMGTDTSVQANDAVMSGAGGNYIRCTFATNATMARRASIIPFPAAAAVDNRGTYRVFVRTRRSDATSVIKMRLAWRAATGVATGDPVTTRAQVGRTIYDLGLITFPAVPDPVFDGFSGVEMPPRGVSVGLDIERTSGAGTIDVDYLLFVPADDAMAIVDWPDGGGLGGDEMVIDGANEVVYGLEAGTNRILTMNEAPALAGGFVKLSPGVTNRMFFLKHVDDLGGDTIAGTTTVTVSYWPRYLNVKPVAS